MLYGVNADARAWNHSFAPARQPAAVRAGQRRALQGTDAQSRCRFSEDENARRRALKAVPADQHERSVQRHLARVPGLGGLPFFALLDLGLVLAHHEADRSALYMYCARE